MVDKPTNLIDQLKRDEGTILHAYQDQLGFWTIGTGILIDKRKGGGITNAENEMLLGNRIASKALELNAKAPWTLNVDPVRRCALLNMSFNLGVDGLLKFERTLSFLRLGAYDKIRAELIDTPWHSQVGPRADRLIKQFESGEWQ